MNYTFQFEGIKHEVSCELDSPPVTGWHVRTKNDQYWEIAEIELNILEETRPSAYVFCKQAKKSLIQAHFDLMK